MLHGLAPSRVTRACLLSLDQMAFVEHSQDWKNVDERVPSYLEEHLHFDQLASQPFPGSCKVSSIDSLHIHVGGTP